MKKSFILLLNIFLFFNNVFSSVTFPFVLPWNDSSNTVIDLSNIVYRDINAEGFVRVTPDGHFAVNSGRIKFWGTNTTFGANFPSKSNAPYVAARLAKYGFNIVRFHHMDMYDIWITVNPDRVLNPTKLDLLDYFIYQLKQKGIYVDLNLLVSRPFNRGTDLPADIDMITDWKVRDALGFFDPQTRQLQKDYARDLLTHNNPYTGNTYVNEPAVAFIEINNENGLTQAYLSSQIDNLPPYYNNLLKTQWNNWLKNKYPTHAALEAAWGAVNQPLGTEMLTNGRFTTGSITPWVAEFHSGAAGTAVVETGTGPGGLNCARINVTTAGSAGWHVQFNQPNLSVTAGTPYTITFYARADTNRTIDVSLMMAHDPWSNLGFSAQLNLTNTWQLFTFTFSPHTSDTNARINFGGMGLYAGGSFYFTDISLKPGGLYGLKPGENLYTTGIDNFKNQGDIARTVNGRKDWFRFLQETERNYWIEMRDYIRNTLGAHALIFGTIIGCSTPNVQSVYDAIDTHAYWQHPEFPGVPWSSTDWYIRNNPMVNNQQGSTVAGLGMKAVLNKPHCLTEYNHPHPYSYEAESMYFMSTYGSLQDWDAVFEFDYNGSDNWNTQRIEGYFGVNQNTVKMASMIPAALAFYRGDIKPATGTVVIPIGWETEIEELLDTWAWWLVDGAKVGENPKTALIHKVRIAVDGQSVPPGSIPPGSTNTTGNIMISDTGEIIWDASNASAGYVRVNTQRTKFLYGFISGKTHYLSGVTITPGATLTNGFSTIAITALDGDSFATAQKILITALGTQYNTNAQFYQYPNTLISFPPAMGINVTLRNQWGTSPVIVEGIPATIILPCQYNNTSAWALDVTGARKLNIPVTNNGGYASITIDPSYQTVWYEISVYHSSYTATATRTNTPIYSPTATPTITNTATPAIGLMVDDCENTGTNQNLWGGWWYTYADGDPLPNSSITGGKQTTGGPVTTLGKYRATGNKVNDGWAGFGTNLSSNGAEVDLTSFEGIRMYVRGDGTPLNIAIVTGNFSDIPDYNNWQYTVLTTSEWTLISVPFSSFTLPYGTYRPFDLTRAEDIQWKINEDGAFDVEIDDVMFYYPQTPYTFTATVTRTLTVTPTLTNTIINQTKLNIEEIRIFPNPYNYEKDKLKLFLKLNGQCDSIAIKIYTGGLRLIKTIVKDNIVGNIIEIGKDEFKNLANGYYLVVIVAENKREKISSHIQELIILR
ncbi:MAG: CIA30 family protein [Candidatus Goldbacteria bacterium]|nr:CIA30 family protein [Candidatus Goldiibacteriota bacterium]